MGRSDPKVPPGRRMTDINNERLLYVLACLVGREVEVQMKNNSYVRGLFHSCEAGLKGSEKRDMEITLHHARELPAVDKLSGEIQRMLIIPGNQFVAMCAESCPLEFIDPEEEAKEQKAKHSHSSFQTDNEICNSKASLGQERELQKWMCEEGGDDVPLELNVMLEDPNATRGWDQFELNKRRFGVQTTYEDEFYTTPLDVKSIPRFIQERADRIAREIENQPNFGFADPERIAEGDLNEDEEALFSAVRGTGGYKDRHTIRNVRAENQRNGIDRKGGTGGVTGVSIGVGGGNGNPKVNLRANENTSSSVGGGVAMKVSSSSLKELRENLECAARENNAKKNINLSDENLITKTSGFSSGMSSTNGTIINTNNDNSSCMISNTNSSSAETLSYNNNVKSLSVTNVDLSNNNNLSVPSFSPSSASSSNSYELHQQHKKVRGMLSANSPTRSPICSVELKGINALNLEPALPKLDEHTRNEWINFKQTQSRQNRGTSFVFDRQNEKREFENALKVINERLSKGKITQHSNAREREVGNSVCTPTVAGQNGSNTASCNNSMSSLLSGALQVTATADSPPSSSRQFSSSDLQQQQQSGSILSGGLDVSFNNNNNSTSTHQPRPPDIPLNVHGDAIMNMSNTSGCHLHNAAGSITYHNNSLNSVSSINKKSFQFNPNANAFTPSTPSSAACGAPRIGGTADSVTAVAPVVDGNVNNFTAVNNNVNNTHNATSNITTVNAINANNTHNSNNVVGSAAPGVEGTTGEILLQGAPGGGGVNGGNNINMQQTNEININTATVIPTVACNPAATTGGGAADVVGVGSGGGGGINAPHIVATQNAISPHPQPPHTDHHANHIIAVAGSAASHIQGIAATPFAINAPPMQFNLINNLIPNLIHQSPRPQQQIQPSVNFTSLANNNKANRLSINDYLNQIMTNVRRENLESSAYEWMVLNDLSYKNILGEIPATNQALLSAVVQHGNAPNPLAHIGGGAAHAFFHHPGMPPALIATGGMPGGGGVDPNGACPPLGALPYPTPAMMYGNAFPLSQSPNAINALTAAAQLGVGAIGGAGCLGGGGGVNIGGGQNQIPPTGMPPAVRPGPNPHVQAAAAAAANALTHLPSGNTINTQNAANIPTVMSIQTPINAPMQHPFHPIISQGFQLQNPKYGNPTTMHGLPAHMINPYAPYAFTLPQTPQQFGGNVANQSPMGENRVGGGCVAPNHMSTPQQQNPQNNANQQNGYHGGIPHNSSPTNLPPHPHTPQMANIPHNQHSIPNRQNIGGGGLNNAPHNVPVQFTNSANAGQMHTAMK